LYLNVNIASWGSTGGWKPNSAVYISKKACSAIKNVAGNAWFSALKGFKVSTDSCPLPAVKYKNIKNNCIPRRYTYLIIYNDLTIGNFPGEGELKWN